jgi:hypothetical protein
MDNGGWTPPSSGWHAYNATDQPEHVHFSFYKADLDLDEFMRRISEASEAMGKVLREQAKDDDGSAP